MAPKAAFPVRFYHTPAGNEPTVDWFRALARDDRKKIGAALLRVQENWPIGMPVCKPLGKGLWEVRASLEGNRIARVLFFVGKDEICVVHAFIKKTQKTPREDLELAQRRMKEMTQ